MMNQSFGPITLVQSGKDSVKPLVENNKDQKELARLKKACAEVESLFFSSLLKSLKGLIPQTGLLPKSAGMSIYDSMFDQEISSFLSQGQTIGLGRMLYQQLLRDRDPNIIKSGGELPRFKNPLPLYGDDDRNEKSRAAEVSGRSGEEDHIPSPLPRRLNNITGRI